VTVPGESEGDGFARMRVFFAEIEASVELIGETVKELPAGPVATEYAPSRPGAALGWVEAPGGAAFHWVRTDARGNVVRWRLGTPAFTNWHGFHLAAERFAFQDFPIILASMGLSIAESDR
jgi:Ni,Fe-hydrogenase III large subunit